jgi:cysteinyl-tRNA synthetase, unknown class
VDLARDGGSDYFTRTEIERAQRQGTMILAYFEIGAIENYRPEWKAVPEDVKAGAVGGWPNEQYVKFWDDRWWPVVQGRIDQALKAGFDGAYLDLVTCYEEIPIKDIPREELARRMVDLVSRISQYAKGKRPDFKIVPQNCPELCTWSAWKPQLNKKYLDAIDGLGMEDVFYLAHDKPADKPWCKVNRDNALAIKKAGKPVLAIDYCTTPECAADAYAKERAIGFVPYVSVRNLDVVLREGQTMPKRSKRAPRTR